MMHKQTRAGVEIPISSARLIIFRRVGSVGPLHSLCNASCEGGDKSISPILASPFLLNNIILLQRKILDRKQPSDWRQFQAIEEQDSKGRSPRKAC
jgi:hypothetical protein